MQEGENGNVEEVKENEDILESSEISHDEPSTSLEQKEKEQEVGAAPTYKI